MNLRNKRPEERIYSRTYLSVTLGIEWSRVDGRVGGGVLNGREAEERTYPDPESWIEYRSSGVFDYGPREVEVYVVYRIYGVVVRCLVSQWHHNRSIYICELGMRTSRSRIYFHWTQTILRKHQLINQQIPPAQFAHTQSLEFNHFNCARAQTL